MASDPVWSKSIFRLTDGIGEDNAVAYDEVRVTVLKATMAILSLSLALISICLVNWWT